MLRYLTAGESHGEALVGIVEGMPAGVPLTAEDINRHLRRRWLGFGRGGRSKFERDRVHIYSGVRFSKTIAGPVALRLDNAAYLRDRSGWPEVMAVGGSGEGIEPVTLPRPGHADLVGARKYGFDDIRSVVDRASARDTAIRVACCSVARALLKQFGIEIGSHVVRIGSIGHAASAEWRQRVEELASEGAEAINVVADESAVRMLDNELSRRCVEHILETKRAGDSLGGTYEVIATGVPSGLGSYVHWDRRLNGQLAQAILSIQAQKAVEIGDGVAAAHTPGSKYHDTIYRQDGDLSPAYEPRWRHRRRNLEWHAYHRSRLHEADPNLDKAPGNGGPDHGRVPSYPLRAQRRDERSCGVYRGRGGGCIHDRERVSRKIRRRQPVRNSSPLPYCVRRDRTHDDHVRQDFSGTDACAMSTNSGRRPYDPAAIERNWYHFWEKNGFFRADRKSGKKPHVIMMPPPNVTGALHMGHALQDTVQDALNRIRRMQGFEALWMPGKDHAGIATQNVVERTLKETEGITRHELGRETLVARIWEWVEEYGDRILQQKRRLGDSCDWERERFTMDERYVRAVQRVFVELYEQGLIYRGHYLVNWCPVDRTALSDEEVDNVERDGNLWHIRYPVPDAGAYVTVATTRPETMLGDTAVAVHPDDERYRQLVGKEAVLPLVNRRIPIIADPYVKKEFAAGALKVTPAHDKNDYEIGRRHGLKVISVIATDATISENGGAYAGLDRFVARERIVADLESLGLLEKTEPYRVSVPISHRSKAVIEPLLSRQWFVKMKPLADPALEAVRDGRIRFHPKRWENEYFRWLEGIRDWCISRQLWWGHRIPVWYYSDTAGVIDESQGFVVSIECPEPGMVQDEDVLDTWFSSWLFPFATLGWPYEDEDTREDLAFFHPTDVLVSGYDILYFWIARMIMASLHFMGEIPYRDIFITGMIKDKQGRWMSKSLGNGIDPIEMIEQYGSDAVRYSLTVLCAQGQDIKLDPTVFEKGRNFANKIWNAFNVFGRFMQPGKDYRRIRAIHELELVEKWMLTRLARTIEAAEEDIARYRLNEALTKIYTLFWGDYCDWYLELIKPARGEDMSEETIALAVELYEKMVQLLHPFMPFITEELWHRLRPRRPLEACIASTWPDTSLEGTDDAAHDLFALVQEMTTGIRNVRSRYRVAPGKQISAVINLPPGREDVCSALNEHRRYFGRLARAGDVTIGCGLDRPEGSASVVIRDHEVYLPLAGLVDVDKERGRLAGEIRQKEAFLARIRGKLNNDRFASRAPVHVVEHERQKEKDAMAEIRRLRANLKAWAEL